MSASWLHLYVYVYLPVSKVADAVIIGLMAMGACQWLERRKYHVPWWLQHSTWMYAFLLGALLATTWTFCLEYWRQGDPNDQVQPLKHLSIDRAVIQKCETAWNSDVSLEEYPTLLRFASLTPCWVVGVFSVSAMHTFRHIRHASLTKHGALLKQQTRVMTTWILALPVVYSIAALYAVEIALRRARL